MDGTQESMDPFYYEVSLNLRQMIPAGEDDAPHEVILDLVGEDDAHHEVEITGRLHAENVVGESTGSHPSAGGGNAPTHEITVELTGENLAGEVAGGENLAGEVAGRVPGVQPIPVSGGLAPIQEIQLAQNASDPFYDAVNRICNESVRRFQRFTTLPPLAQTHPKKNKYLWNAPILHYSTLGMLIYHIIIVWMEYSKEGFGEDEAFTMFFIGASLSFAFVLYLQSTYGILHIYEATKIVRVVMVIESIAAVVHLLLALARVMMTFDEKWEKRLEKRFQDLENVNLSLLLLLITVVSAFMKILYAKVVLVTEDGEELTLVRTSLTENEIRYTIV